MQNFFYDVSTMITLISASSMKLKTAAVLRKIKTAKQRFIITEKGKPTAVLLNVSDFDDMLEELDPIFQESLIEAHDDHQKGSSVVLKSAVK